MTDTETDNYIYQTMKAFKLVDMRDRYPDAIEAAEKEHLSYRDFLRNLLDIEVDGKTRRRTERLTHQASFESPKSLEDIDYSFNASLDHDQITSLGHLDFLKRHENIIIIGPPGVGKSMIATGIGRKACKEGYRVLFVNAKELMDDLSEDVQKGTLRDKLKALAKVDLLILDELSYLKMDKEKESLFFQIVRQRYEKSSLIITTNLPLGRWDELFTGQLAATAILDRLVHHCHVMSITGDSYRVKGPKDNVSTKNCSDQRSDMENKDHG
ncbi:MAG: IS21-like element helper ATPase IstB [Lachnospiraceae bacterium]|nr:IS21-like element helper ATPase IstB [Lachnospiraceae bacterium]